MIAMDKQAPGNDLALVDEVKTILHGSLPELAIPAGATIFGPGDECERLAILSSGTVKVHLVAESGREIILYRVKPGQVCALSLGCLINNTAYRASGIAESDIIGVAINREHFDELFALSGLFREQVLASQTGRILDLVTLLEDFAFRPIEQRLARLLAQQSDGEHPLARTHQDMAIDLGTAREVVSRTLKRFEAEGYVELTRGSVIISDRAGLIARYGQ